MQIMISYGNIRKHPHNLTHTLHTRTLSQYEGKLNESINIKGVKTIRPAFLQQQRETGKDYVVHLYVRHKVGVFVYLYTFVLLLTVQWF